MYLKNSENKKCKYKCSSREEGLNKLWYIDITEYFILLKRMKYFSLLQQEIILKPLLFRDRIIDNLILS